MFEKAKEFYQKHKKVIIITAGSVAVVATGIIVGKTFKDLSKIFRDGKAAEALLNTKYDDTAERALLESFGAVYKNGYSTVPFATKEVATKFMEEMGNTYQIDIFDIGKPYETAAIWISKEVV
jgi:putative intracellular protease/amidase